MTKEEDDQTNATEEVKELKQKSEELSIQISSLADQLARVSAQTNLLTKYSSGLLEAGKEASTSDLLDIKTIGNYFISCSNYCSMVILYREIWPTGYYIIWINYCHFNFNETGKCLYREGKIQGFYVVIFSSDC